MSQGNSGSTDTQHELFDSIFEPDGENKVVVKHVEAAIFLDVEPHYRPIRRESDRGALLVAACIVGEKLQLMIDAYLIDPKGKNKRVANSFEYEIILSYRLGLISYEFSKMLHALRIMRNEKAHDYAETRLEDLNHELANAIKEGQVFDNLLVILDKRCSKITGEKPLNDFTHMKFIRRYGARPTFNLLFSIICVMIEGKANNLVKLKHNAAGWKVKKLKG